MTVQDANIYTDFSGLGKLRQQARDNSPAALRAVAQQFEGIFMQMVLKSMRDASFGDELFDSAQSDMYRDLFDHQISLNMSSKGGLGLADMIVKQLEAGVRMNASEKAEEVSFERLRIGARTPAVPLESGTPVLSGFGNPTEFVQAIWKHAKAAAEELGISAKALVAQAALETGWGSRMIKDERGRDSHNLFGIKADERWNGPRVEAQTKEFENGEMWSEQAQFRKYSSFAESFADYVRFLKSNPRYQGVHGQQDGQAFAESLQGAGYATDPAYANKIQNILSGQTLRQALGALNVDADEPISL